MTTATTNGTGGTERHAALAAYAESVAAGVPLTGAQLGERFGRSERWGRSVVAEARSDGSVVPPVAAAGPAATGGNGQVSEGADREVVEGGPVVPAVAVPQRQGWLDTFVVLAVAAVAAAASYGHMQHVATLAGEPEWIAYLFPIAVDGLALAAFRAGERGRWWLVLALAVSVSANVLSQYPDLVAQVAPAVSAWPPIALYGTHRLRR